MYHIYVCNHFPLEFNLYLQCIYLKHTDFSRESCYVCYPLLLMVLFQRSVHPCKLQSSLSISFELSHANRFAPNSRLLRKNILSFAGVLLGSQFSLLRGWLKLSSGFVMICSVYPLNDGHWHSKFELLLEM